MRSSKVLLVGVLIGLFAMNLHAQSLVSTTISRKLSNNPPIHYITLSEALSNLEKDFKVHILYDDTAVEGKYVSASASTEQGFQEILEAISGENNLNYKKVGAKTIVLRERESEQSSTAARSSTSRVEIQGVVVDKSKGAPLPGANVIIKGTSVGAATDLDGKFAFGYSAKDQKFTILVSFMGYKSQERELLPTDDLSNLRFELAEDVFLGEAVVVTGIASKRSKDIAEIAVARIAAADLTAKNSYTGLSQLISGKVSGVTTQIASGNVGSGWRFHVRGGGGLTGNGQPVIYLDGVRISNDEFSLGWTGGQSVSDLSNLNPNDVESVEILKGPAAAAMYGTSGSNGVVLITTKRGKLSIEPGVPNIEYHFTYGTNQRFFTYNENEYVNAEFFNKLIEPPGVIREHQVSVSGGTSQFSYLTSFTNRFEEGLLGFQNWMDRNSLRVNVNAVPRQDLSIKVSTGFTWNKLRQPQMDNNVYSWNSNAFTYQKRWNNADSIAIARYETLNDSKQFIGSGQVVWKPFANFEINGGAGIESVLWDGTDYRPYGLRYQNNYRGGKWISRRSTNQYTYDFNARYLLSLYGVNLTSIVGTQVLERRYFETYEGGDYFSNPVITEIQATEIWETEDAGEWRTHSREAGIYWNNEFSFKDTYFWTLAIRRDYASVIGVEAPAATYPKGSLAIRADKFGILPKDIGMMKLRVAYGETGQLPGLDDAIPITWGSTLGYNATPAYYVQSKGNSAIKPERIKEWEFGFDTEFLNMFSLEFTHWRENATDCIVPTTTSPSTGLYNFAYPVNVGSIKAWGFETLLQINPIRTPNYDLNLSFIWNYQTNKVMNLGESDEILLGRSEVFRVGLPKYEFYDFVPISPKFDANNKYIGVNLSTERVALGNPIPDHSGSVAINFRFLKNFNFYAAGEWALHLYVYSNALNRFWNYNTHVPQRRLAIALGYHKYGQGQFLPIDKWDSDVEILTPGTQEYIDAAWDYMQYERTAANYVKPADYFVFRELSLGYNCTELLQKYLPNNYVKTLNMGIAVRNVWRTSKYDLGFEVSARGGRSAALSEDYNTLMHPRSISFWTKVGL